MTKADIAVFLDEFEFGLADLYDQLKYELSHVESILAGLRKLFVGRDMKWSFHKIGTRQNPHYIIDNMGEKQIRMAQVLITFLEPLLEQYRHAVNKLVVEPGLQSSIGERSKAIQHKHTVHFTKKANGKSHLHH